MWGRRMYKKTSRDEPSRQSLTSQTRLRPVIVRDTLLVRLIQRDPYEEVADGLLLHSTPFRLLGSLL